MRTATLIPVAELRARLAGGELFSAVARDLAGEDVCCPGVIRSAPAELSPQEHRLLDTAAGISWGLRRLAVMRAVSGRPVGRVASVYLPSRLPAAVRIALFETQVPLGVLLEPYGVQRTPLDCPPSDDPAVALTSAGLLTLPGPGRRVPVALAAEALLA